MANFEKSDVANKGLSGLTVQEMLQSLPEAALEGLERHARASKISLLELLLLLLTEEGERLMHVERSRPKESKKPPREGPGRPPLTPTERKARQVTLELMTISARLQEALGPEAFEKMHGPWVREATEAIKAKNYSKLFEISRRQPWVRGWDE